ncbi:unnamed protein product [Darwinula stevensoni]|uniref:Dynactin subunit 4 n=1 Tax=Darwinula stevensoni TaxID=69355 RepID=A0A7R9AA62_9CRUS|nr:unnamed protein product [Darwinula stevensoni]CAG0898065.1 unnamed protein product [Darwinula stevensoni]
MLQLHIPFCHGAVIGIASVKSQRVRKSTYFGDDGCGSCLDCPVCGHHLSTRMVSSTPSGSTSSPVPPTNKGVSASSSTGEESPSQSATAKRVYYLACSVCHWNSREASLPDQNVAKGGWPTLENLDAKTIESNIEHYSALVYLEKAERLDPHRRALKKPRSYYFLSERYHASAASARLRAGLPPLSVPSPRSGSDPIPQPSRKFEATDDLPRLLPKLLTEHLVLDRVTGISERHACPELQAELPQDLHPIHRHLSVKRSLRCRSCEHNVCRPEHLAMAIKFKIQNAAYYHIPEVRLGHLPVRTEEDEWDVLLIFINHSKHEMKIQIQDLNEWDPEEKVKEFQKGKGSEKAEDGLHVLSVPLVLEPRRKFEMMADVSTLGLPSGDIIVDPLDEAADIGSSSFSSPLDPSSAQFPVIVWRSENKVAVGLRAKGKISMDASAKMGFLLQYDCLNKLSDSTHSPGSKVDTSQQPVPVQIPIFVHLGHIY